jgi:hypothetical protein
MIRHYERCPACKTPTEGKELYCSACGEAVSYEDHEADVREAQNERFRRSLRYFVNTLIATGLLLCLALVLLYFWGDKARAATTIIVGTSAALEAEETTCSLVKGSIHLPHWPAAGPLVLSFRYGLAPPSTTLYVDLLAEDREKVVATYQLPARFLFGEAVFRLALAEIDEPLPLIVRLRQGKKFIVDYELVAPQAEVLR